jgi:hypothetical protein
VLRCNTHRHALRSEGIRSLLFGRSVAIRSWRQRHVRVLTGPRMGRAFPGLGSEVMALSLLLTNRRQWRATVNGGGVSNR